MGTIWFDRPAERWEEALPIGNGRLGAMIFGGMAHERVALNQDSIWYGGPVDRINPDARENLPHVRSLILEGKIPEAEELLRLAFSGTPQSQRPYQPLGDIEIDYRMHDTVGADGGRAGYRRNLDLDNGLVTELCREGGRELRKEYFASYPHGVIAIHMSAGESTISLIARLERGRFFDRAGKLDDRTIYMDGSLGEGGVAWTAALRAESQGGRTCVLGDSLVIRGAKELTLYLGCETSFYEKEHREALRSRLDCACLAGYGEVKRRHIEDFRELMGRVSLDLGEEDTRPIDAQRRKAGQGSSFAALYFQYGRYLLVSSSRPGSLPANLQGVWNESMTPPWDSKFTININTEMNYWPAESCALPECHLPLFDHLMRMWENGKRVAREMYGCGGFTAHHNTDIWGDCAPQDIYVPATYWVMGGAWLCTHIMRHYEYTGDGPFLERMYPVLEDAVLFFHDFLVEVDGKLMTCPSISPENTYILPDGVTGCVGAGCTMDNEILRDLMEDYLKASAVLGRENARTERTWEILTGLPGIRTGAHGQIMEWREDYGEAEPGHRHISQLYALFPSNQITLDRTPELARAARRTLELRLANGGGHTGWSRAWIAGLYARLGDGDSALEHLEELWRSSTFPNLMDCHPLGDGRVFQIDGNLGATAAIAQMLVQSDEECVKLLPALPARWSEGRVTGLTCVGGVRLDVSWRDGRLTECVACSPKAACVTFRYGSEARTCTLDPGRKHRIF